MRLFNLSIGGSGRDFREVPIQNNAAESFAKARLKREKFYERG